MYLKTIAAALAALTLSSTASAQITYQTTAASLDELRVQSRLTMLEHHKANLLIQSELSQENEDAAGWMAISFWFYPSSVDMCAARATYEELADNSMTAGAYQSSLDMVALISTWCPPRRAVGRRYVLSKR